MYDDNYDGEVTYLFVEKIHCGVFIQSKGTVDTKPELIGTLGFILIDYRSVLLREPFKRKKRLDQSYYNYQSTKREKKMEIRKANSAMEIYLKQRLKKLLLISKDKSLEFYKV
ncbi:hypothetical protein PUN28_011609 [Cardiocondyla obscurior]|uniref:Uncharacterized protein n=1 Tax=Cardiocondyla obscurior TaxID=286306 RepID=A0AAW2FER9_9HYME